MTAPNVGLRLFFGGNWKEGKTGKPMTPTAAKKWVAGFKAQLTPELREKIKTTGTGVMIAPPASCLTVVRAEIDAQGLGDVLEIGVQDPWIASGAYTGTSVTFESALDPLIGAKYAIIGHSESRTPVRTLAEAILKALDNRLDPSGFIYEVIHWIEAKIGLDTKNPLSVRLAFEETIRAQIRKALAVNMTPILCVGETESERNTSGSHPETISLEQLHSALTGFTAEEASRMIIAYEPVWAIGTGKTATPVQAEEVHEAISLALFTFTRIFRHGIRIIYGGSMDANNVGSLVGRPKQLIRGGLIGGASLDPASFLSLISNGIAAATDVGA